MKTTPNYGLKLPEDNDFGDVAVLNENTLALDGLLRTAITSAAEYSLAGIYAVGDYCTHGGKLWRCIAAILAAEPWTPAHWAETNTAAELASIAALAAGKADKLIPSAAGNLAGLDAAGSLTDSGKKVGDFLSGAAGAVTTEKLKNGAVTEEKLDPVVKKKMADKTPAAHKRTHQTGGTDALVPGDIGAYTKEETLSDATAAVLGLSAAATPNEATAQLSRFHAGLGNEYLWEKVKYHRESYLEGQQGYSFTNNFMSQGGMAFRTIRYANAIEIISDSELRLKAPYTEHRFEGPSTPLPNFSGKYFQMGPASWNPDAATAPSQDSQVFLATGNMYVQPGDPNGDRFDYLRVMASAVKVKVVTDHFGFVNSPNEQAYPPAPPDSYTYLRLGTIGTGAHIVLGTYLGSGTYGSSNPCSLTFDFVPKLILIPISDSNPMYCKTLLVPSTMRTDVFVDGDGFGYADSNNSQRRYGKKSVDSKTVAWYNSSSTDGQFNILNQIYTYIAIG